MAKIIEVTVSPKGETSIETRGFYGAECREASRALEAALGLRSRETLTAEFHHIATEEPQTARCPSTSG